MINNKIVHNYKKIKILLLIHLNLLVLINIILIIKYYLNKKFVKLKNVMDNLYKMYKLLLKKILNLIFKIILHG
jgi:hypothetical protein